MDSMKALVIQHDHMTPVGLVGERLSERGFTLEEILVVPESSYHQPNIPREFPDFRDYDLLVPLGAPWGAWDDGCIGNWLQPELEWIGEAVRANHPVLGICFGGQLVARAMGGSVAPAPRGEVGWTAIHSDDHELIGEGPWFQYHFDRFVVPPGATEIARNPYASQAFVINRTLGLQFHPEITPEILDVWLDGPGRAQVQNFGMDPDIMLTQTTACESEARARAFHLVDAFLDRVAGLS